MHQHLVDDDLEEQRRDERKELKEERGDQYLAKQTAIFVDRAQEPGDIEAARKIHQPGAPRHQNNATIPDRSSSARVISAGRGDNGDWTMALSSPALPRIRKPPSRSTAMAGSGCTAQPCPGRLASLRFEPELLCAAEHLGNADRRAAKAVPDLLGIGTDAVKAQQAHQGGEALIDYRHLARI